MTKTKLEHVGEYEVSENNDLIEAVHGKGAMIVAIVYCDAEGTIGIDISRDVDADDIRKIANGFIAVADAREHVN